MFHLHSASVELGRSRVPLYQAADGRTSNDPLTLAGPHPTFSLRKLSLYLSLPALVSKFAPDSPWSGVSLLHSFTPWSVGQETSRAEEFVERFQSGIRRCMGNAATVAIAASGGLASTALLLHAGALCEQEGRRLIALLIDRVDDAGQSTAEVMTRLMEQLHLPCERLVIIKGGSEREWPAPGVAWNPHGPCIERWPLRKALAEAAATWRAGILLTGHGADELLAAPRFLLPRLLSKHRGLSALAYLADQGPGRIGPEALSLLAPLLPKETAARFYWAKSRTEFRDSPVSPVLAEPYRAAVASWTAEWVASTLACYAAQGTSWAYAAARDALLPKHELPENGELAQASPFLDSEFAGYAMGLPLESRYSRHFAAPSQRRRALIMRLYPHGIQGKLPPKQSFTRTAGATSPLPTMLERARRCLAYGLVSEEALIGCQDQVFLEAVEALGHWIAGAEARGFTVAHV